MKKLKLHYFFLTLLLISVSAMQAQVTIGSANKPAQGALLDLKEYEADPLANGSSATRGLGMPRVELVVLNQLFPMFEGLNGAADKYTKDNVDYDKAEEDFKHIGLTVYNLINDEAEGLEKGIYFWDGSRWVVSGRQTITGLKFFYMPSIDISFSSVGRTTINLYEQYTKQFSKTDNSTFVSSDSEITTVPAPSNGTLYLPSQLSYAVTYYDNKVMKVYSISSTGVMDYEILSIKTTAASYINIVFIIK